MECTLNGARMYVTVQSIHARNPHTGQSVRRLLRPIAATFCVFAAAGAGRGATSSAEGSIQSRAAPSGQLGRDIPYQVYMPPDHDAAGGPRYPVLYLLHGRGDRMTAWGTIKPDLDRLIGTGRIPPVIAIMPDATASRRAGYYVDSQFTGAGGLPAGEAVEAAFTKDLIAHVDATFPTRTNRNSRIVAGYSMGGYGAMRYALAHPALFGAAIVLSPAVYVPQPPKDSSTREFGAFGKGTNRFDTAVYAALNYPALIPRFTDTGLPLHMFIAVGDDETALSAPAEASHDLDYEAHTLYNTIRRIPRIHAQLRVIDGGHNWSTWRPAFTEGLEHVFRRLEAAPTATATPR